jgi:hypothetical protein
VRCPGAHRLRPRQGWPPSCRLVCSRWSGGCRERAESLPAGQERFRPWPVGADLQGAVADAVEEFTARTAAAITAIAFSLHTGLAAQSDDEMQAIRRGTFTYVKDLIAAIETYIDGWNDRCQPFIRTGPPPTGYSTTASQVKELRSRDTRPS